MTSQNDQILTALKRGKSVSALEALMAYGCLRLAARIHELRIKGYRIETKTIRKGSKSYSNYILIS